MTKSTANQLQRLCVLAILASAIMVTPASAAGGALKVDITRYEPYPAEIGKYVVSMQWMRGSSLFHVGGWNSRCPNWGGVMVMKSFIIQD